MVWIRVRRTGIDAAIIVIAVSAVANIMRLTVATKVVRLTTRTAKKGSRGGHLLVSGLLIPDKVAVLAIDVNPALEAHVSIRANGKLGVTDDIRRVLQDTHAHRHQNPKPLFLV